MFKKIFVICSLMIFFNSDADKYRGASSQKLENGVTVVFADSTKSGSALVMLCISSGSTDEIEKRGVANLLGYMFSKKIKEKIGADSLQYGSESDSYVGYDQTIYYVYGKNGNLEGFIKNLATLFSDFTFSVDELNAAKKITEQQIAEDLQIDKNCVRDEVRKSLYWHSNYGTRISGNIEDLKLITEDDLRDFKNKFYTNDRVTVIVAGSVNKKDVIELISKKFKKDKNASPVNRLQEPPHHGSTVRITKCSAQVNVPIIELYWKIPNYRNQKDKALAAEIFVNYLSEALQKNMNSKTVASMSFCYSFWNYDYGEFCLTITSKNSDNIENDIVAVLSEIKYIASEKIAEEQAKKAAKKLSDSTNVFHFNTDILDFVDWVSKKIGSGHSFDFLKSYYDFANKFNLNEINEQAKIIFRNDPCVISIVKPAENKKNAD